MLIHIFQVEKEYLQLAIAMVKIVTERQICFSIP